MLKIMDLNFGYNKDLTIRNLNLEVATGNFLGILGPNGSGKTTLLKLILKQLASFGGEILINNKNINKYSSIELARTVAVVPQESPILFNFNALEIVLMGRAPYLSRFGFEQKVDLDIAKQWMIQTNTWQFRDRNINELSGGEKQRVIVARALTQEPSLLLLDEPTSFLDIKHQMDIYNLVAKLNSEKKLTVITVLHDINLASLFCDKICLLKSGEIKHLGSTKNTITYNNIKNIFDTDVYVGINDLTGNPYYTPIRDEQ